MSVKTESKKIPYGSIPYFAIIGVGGMISSAGTHMATTPLDLVKCRMQINPQKYNSLFNGFRITFKEEGARGLVGGWAPTAVGYGLRGFCKFGIYEYSKCHATKFFGEENAHKYRFLIYLGSATLAEGIGDIILAPFETAKIRTQTDNLAPRDMRSCMALLYKEGGIPALFKGLAPLWMRQIPTVATKFMTFELTMESLYHCVLNKKRKECTSIEQMGVTVTSSAVAGVCCSVISHPADVLVSQICNHKNMTFMEAVRTVGARGMWTGLGARTLMITWIASAQLNTVELTKMIFNLELSGK